MDDLYDIILHLFYVVPLPSLMFDPSKIPNPGYTRAVNSLGMFGEGDTYYNNWT